MLDCSVSAGSTALTRINQSSILSLYPPTFATQKKRRTRRNTFPSYELALEHTGFARDTLLLCGEISICVGHSARSTTHRGIVRDFEVVVAFTLGHGPGADFDLISTDWAFVLVVSLDPGKTVRCRQTCSSPPSKPAQFTYLVLVEGPTLR